VKNSYPTPGLESYTLIHKGLLRENNEDRLSTYAFLAGTDKSVPALLAVLADGVGGHQGGEVAAQIAVDMITAYFKEHTTISCPSSSIENAIQNANRSISDLANSNPSLRGMGTTCVCVLVIGGRLQAAHLGDSRLYLLRKKNLHQLTIDHTWLEDNKLHGLKTSGGMTRFHPLAHVISRYLGAPSPIEVDQFLNEPAENENHLILEEKDVLLLCSDGLTDLINDDEIEHILNSCSGRKRAQTLVFQALQHGGNDNVSVIVLNVTAVD
jgi:serine/threonine protein phosphatase PrpC